MDIVSPSDLLPFLHEALPGIVTLYVPPAHNNSPHMLRRISMIATSIGMRLEHRTITTCHAPLQWCVAVKRVSAIDPTRQAYSVVQASFITNDHQTAEAGRFLRQQLFDILDRSPQPVTIYTPEPPVFNRLSESMTSLMSCDSDDESNIFDDAPCYTPSDASPLDHTQIPCCKAHSEISFHLPIPEPESDTSLDEEKRQWVDSLTSLVIQYITRFHESPPMHLIRKEIRGKLLLAPAPVSPVTVNGDMKIFLPTFNEMELRMTPLARTVYILFLCHPEGLRLKDIANHEHQLTEIYSMVKPGSDPSIAAASIADLIDPTGDSLQQKLSLTRRAVRRQILDPSLADHYTIQGSRGGIYRIPLPHDMIQLPAILRHD